MKKKWQKHRKWPLYFSRRPSRKYSHGTLLHVYSFKLINLIEVTVTVTEESSGHQLDNDYESVLISKKMNEMIAELIEVKTVYIL